MAYMNPALFFKIIVPLLEMRQTVLVAISTLVDTWNFFSRLMELKYEDGTSVFDVLPQRMVCDRCIERQEEKCQHNMHLIPPWKSREKHDMARLIYGDDVQALKRESLGIVDNDSGGLFNAARIKSMLTADRVRWEDSMAPPPRFVFVACDPNGGGANHMAMVALVRDASRIVVRCVTWRVFCFFFVFSACACRFFVYIMSEVDVHGEPPMCDQRSWCSEPLLLSYPPQLEQTPPCPIAYTPRRTVVADVRCAPARRTAACA